MILIKDLSYWVIPNWFLVIAAIVTIGLFIFVIKVENQTILAITFILCIIIDFSLVGMVIYYKEGGGEKVEKGMYLVEDRRMIEDWDIIEYHGSNIYTIQKKKE